MILDSLPGNAEWLHAYVLQPHIEGGRRLERVLSGVDAYSLKHKLLSLKDRIVSLVLGLCLMVPLIGTIVWIAMLSLGNPEVLSDPYYVQTDRLRAPARP